MKIQDSYHDALFFATASINEKKDWAITPAQYRVILKLIHYSTGKKYITWTSENISLHLTTPISSIDKSIQRLKQKGYINVWFTQKEYKVRLRTIQINWEKIQEIDNLCKNNNTLKGADMSAPNAEQITENNSNTEETMDEHLKIKAKSIVFNPEELDKMLDDSIKSDLTQDNSIKVSNTKEVVKVSQSKENDVKVIKTGVDVPVESEKLRDLRMRYEYEQKYAKGKPLTPATFNQLTNDYFIDKNLITSLLMRIDETGTWGGFYKVVQDLNKLKNELNLEMSK